MKMKFADIIFPLLLIIMSVLGMIETNNFTESAALLPRIVFGLIIVLSLVVMGKAVIKKETKWVKINWKRAFTIMGTTVAYVMLLPIIGYYVATILYIAVTMYLFGVRNKITLVAVPIGFVIFVFIIFGKILSLTPPKPFFM